MRSIPLLLFSLFLAIGLQQPIIAQSSDPSYVSATLGVGLPDLVGVGVRLHDENFQLGVSGGTIPFAEDQYYTLTANAFFHLFGSAKHSTRKPWFTKLGFTYLHYETPDVKTIESYLGLSFGREFNFSKHFGVSFDLGALYLLSHESIDKTPSNNPFAFDLDLTFPVLPSASLIFFYKF
ncbi:hypothetical protein [Owenweeksia hongkongensis]|uniref:hypothetical protein n=1 Tax=Owenweeksia hongkongensis TaxID=253245 RepID=UPI003A8E7AB7